MKFGCLHFRHYLNGDPHFTIYTDHKSLIQLLAPWSRPPPRIERMALQIEDFTFQLVYRPGSDNPADVLSRHPRPLPSRRNYGEEADQRYINAVLQAARPNALTIDQIREATTTDSHLQAVSPSLRSGVWYPRENPMRTYHGIRDELSTAASFSVPTASSSQLCCAAKSSSSPTKARPPGHCVHS